MGTTTIEWTDRTWNPVTGCSKVSEGCRNCYAEAISLRFKRSVGPWNAINAAENVVLHPDRLHQPFEWREPSRVFVNSMSDLFHEQVPNNYIDQVFGVMAQARPHTFQILTKRPERMRAYLTSPDRNAKVALAAIGIPYPQWQWPLPNVWLGVSVEDQRAADERIPHLLETPAAVRFLSCEPLIGPVDLERWLVYYDSLYGEPWGSRGDLHWVIVGGESGPKARPMHPDWARSLRDQCVAAGVPFFFKQHGEWSPDRPEGAAPGTWDGGRMRTFKPDGTLYSQRGHDWNDPGMVSMYRVGKKAAGRLLDGREWSQFPAPADGSR